VKDVAQGVAEGNIGIIDTRDITDVFYPVPFRRVIKGPAQPATPPTSLAPSAPSASFIPRHSASPTSSTPSITHQKWKSPTPAAPSTPHTSKKENTDTRGTIDVFHNTPFGIVDVLDAFDLRDRTNLWELFGATVPASPPDTFALLFSALEVLLQRRARPASALPRTLRPSPCHRTCSNISRHDTPLPRCAPAASSHISFASLRRKRTMRRGLRRRRRPSSRSSIKTGSRRADHGRHWYRQGGKKWH